jgi:decaprenylphospho-beta-D-erythro-pentofuranosid-2-ulose 2-reductase
MTGATKRIVILGAASAIGEAAARVWAAQGARLVLVGRNANRISEVASDLKARGAVGAEVVIEDCATADARRTIGQIIESLGGLDVALLAYGALGDQPEMERVPTASAQLLQTNFLSAAQWCLAIAEQFERQGSGALVVIGSVAGDRGRASNYIYGASKAGLGVLVQGLAHRFAKSGVRVVLVKPGFVDTPMTADVGKKGLLWGKPEAIGRIIVRASEQGGPIVYAPSFWRGIMIIVRLLPNQIFSRLRL